MHPSPSERAEHADYQRRLFLAGIIPPLAALSKQIECSCGSTWVAGNEGVYRYTADGRHVYASVCPNPLCQRSHVVS